MGRAVVIDTNVFVSALRSQRGASYRLMGLVERGEVEICVSVPLVLQYEATAKRVARELGLTHADIDDAIDFICGVADRREIHFLWRPFLKDAGDDLVLELAVGAGCERIVTYNLRDFTDTHRFGIRAVTPREYLQEIGERP